MNAKLSRSSASEEKEKTAIATEIDIIEPDLVKKL